MKQIRKFMGNEKNFAIVVSLIITILTFAVFLGQFLWSDVVTFQKSGDNLKQCYPAFLKVMEYIQNGKLLGVDVGTFNGATEFFYRSNLPNMYPFVWLASVFMQFIEARGIYILFYMGHFFVCLYFAQRLAQRYFDINKWFALLFAVGVSRIAILETWYLSHFIIICLVCPLIYSSLEALQNDKKHKWLLYSFPYALAFTSGYITVSVALAVFSWAITLIYGLKTKRNNVKNIVLKSTIPPLIGGGGSFLHCFQLFIYMKEVVQNASSSLHDTLYYKVNIKDIISIFSGAFINLSPMEQLDLITLGVIWTIIIAWVIKYRIYCHQEKGIQFLIKFGIGLNVFFLLVALGIITPIVMWFYTFVPIFGSMHLPMRYMILTLPVLYLALCKAAMFVPEQKGKKTYANLALGSIVGIIVICIMFRQSSSAMIDVDKLIVELLFLSIVCFVIFNYGIGKVFAIVSCLTILFPALNWLYSTNEVDIYINEIEERSIVYNEKYSQILDEFIDKLPRQNRYKFVMFNSNDSVPDFIPGNYEWYNQSRHNLSNYMGYEVQLCLPKDYFKRFWWFNQMDWNYIIDTRGDFLVMDEESYKENMATMDIIVDWKESYLFIDGTHRLFKLKKFIPTHYTNGALYLEDSSDVLDNGYFYSPDLSSNVILDFSTDDATYFNIILNATSETDLAFLLYPNRYYHYFVDEKEISPTIEGMNVYLPLEQGVHNVEIKYVNRLGEVSNIIYLIYYVLLSVSVLLLIINRIISLNRRQRK